MDAGFWDGNRLSDWCENFTGAVYHNTDVAVATKGAGCAGYIIGVTDAFLGGSAFCVPEAVTEGQLTDVLKHWLRDHPDKRHLPAFHLVVSALKERGASKWTIGPSQP